LIQPYELTQTNSRALLLNIAFQYDWNINSSWVAFTRASIRISLGQKNLLDEPFLNGTIPEEPLPSLALGLGYRF
jgi:hypothetical protein